MTCFQLVLLFSGLRRNPPLHRWKIGDGAHPARQLPTAAKPLAAISTATARIRCACYAVVEEICHALSARCLMGKSCRRTLVLGPGHFSTPHGNAVANAARRELGGSGHAPVGVGSHWVPRLQGCAPSSVPICRPRTVPVSVPFGTRHRVTAWLDDSQPSAHRPPNRTTASAGPSC
jgi:hypothetical protein